MIDLTIIIPCFNEEAAISNTIQMLVDEINKNELNWKIIVVNDGSTDNTPRILSEFQNPLVSVIDHPYNKGYGAALKSGIKSTITDYIALFDADGQHSFADLYLMASKVGNVDMLIGARSQSSHQDLARKPGKWVLTKVANYLTESKIPDLNSGLRIIKRNVIVGLLHLFPQGFSFSTTSTVAFMNLGYSVGYFPITVVKRIGKSSVRQLKHGPQTIMLILRLIVLFNPLKVFFPASFYLFFTGLIYELVYGIILYQNGVKLIPAAFFLMLTSILVFFFGLVVDQVSELRKQRL